MNPTPSHILVFRYGQLGDTVAALPSLWVLRRHFPDAQIVMLSETPAKHTHLPPEAILPPAGLVDGFEKYPGGASFRNFLIAGRQVRQLRKRGFETLVYLAPSGRTQRQRLRDRLFFKLCGIRHVLATRGFSEDLHPRLPNGTLIVKPKEADALLDRLGRDGLPIPSPGSGCMDLRITERERANVRDWWRLKTGAQAVPNAWVAIGMGGKFTSKLWPWQRYGEVVHLLIREHGLVPIIIGGKEDRETGEKLLAEWGSGYCAAGELSARESAALMESARFYLGNDSGAMHLAAAVGTPCVGIFSARDWPGIWEPYGNGHKVLRFDVPCSGCLLEICDQNLQCLLGIEVQQAYEACVKVMAGSDK